MTYLAILPIALLGICGRGRGRLFLITWLISSLEYLWIQRWMSGVTAVGWPILCMYLGLYPALFVYFLNRFRISFENSEHESPLVRLLQRIPNVILVPILWTGLEFFRGEIFMDGYPWFLIAHPTIALLPFCQSADLFGTYFLSFITATVAGFLADAIALFVHPRRPWLHEIRLSAVLFLIINIANLAYGFARLNQSPAVDSANARTVTVAAIQTNVPQDNKLSWNNQQQYLDFQELLRLTKLALDQAVADGKKIDLIVWPETMAPGVVFTNQAADAVRKFETKTGYTSTAIAGMSGLYYDETLAELARRSKTPILVGATVLDGLSIAVEYEKDPDGERQAWIRWNYEHHYNSAVLYAADGTRSPTRYDKMRLTPFGEVMPYIHNWPWLQDKLLSIGAGGMKFDLATGKHFTRFSIPLSAADNRTHDVIVATPICFESTVASICRKLVIPDRTDSTTSAQPSDILINMTNDGWFGGFPGGRLQHLQIGRFRCIENRVPMIRAANTGVSASIASSGRLAQTGPNVPANAKPAWEAGAMLVTTTLDGRATLFQAVGLVFGWAVFALTALLTVLSFSRLNRS